MHRFPKNAIRCVWRTGIVLLCMVMSSSSSSTSSTPANVESLTPPFSVLNEIFSTSFAENVNSDTDVLAIASFDWSVWEEDGVYPYIVCTGGGRQGVVSLMSAWHVADSEPLSSSTDMTCYVAYAQRNGILPLVQSIPSLKYIMPMSGLYQLEKNLTKLVASGDFIKNPNECASGLKFMMSPNFARDRTNMETLATKVYNDLNSPETLRTVLETTFYWLTASPEDVPATDATLTWIRGVRNVTQGRVSCDFTGVRVDMDHRTITLSNLCSVGTDCVSTLMAYLSTVPQASHIENVHQVISFNKNAARILQSANSTTIGYPYYSDGLDGLGQTVQVIDSGFDYQSCYLVDTNGVAPPISYLTNCTVPGAYNPSLRKMVGYTLVDTDAVAIDTSGHGTHVAGTVAGFIQNTQPWTSNFAGMAPNAKVLGFGMNNAAGGLIGFSNASSILSCAYAQGVRLTTASVGYGNFYFYESTGLSIDEYLYYHDDYMFIGSAGNDGDFGRKTASIIAFNNNKNGISVGAAQCTFFTELSYPPPRIANMTRIAYFSSIGPAPRGRIKPDIVAPGQSVTSAANNVPCGVVDKQGTSMATPALAGGLALIRQYLVDGYYPTGTKVPANAIPNPSGALLKAFVITSARTMLDYQTSTSSAATASFRIPPMPNIYAGFGLFQLNRVLRLNNQAYPMTYLKDRVPIATNQVITYKFSIPSITKVMAPFEVSIVWTDPPGIVSAGGAVLNNIDLSATLDSDTRGRTIFANNLNGPDIVNNVEKISIANPTLGDVITVRVRGTNIAVTDFQHFAMVAAGVYVPAAWYCQDPRATRPNTLYTTANCRLACQTFKKNPICCPADAGNTCVPAQASDAYCTGLRKPGTC